MKFLHTADWHIGRTLNGFSLLAEQQFAFAQILDLAKEENVDGIIIAGDLYDRSVPSVEAIAAFDHMVDLMVQQSGLAVYAVTGNHDGAKRLNFGHEFFKEGNFHLHTTVNHALVPVETKEVQLFLLPFLDPMDIRVYFKQQGTMADEEISQIKTISDGIKLLVEEMKQQFNPKKRQILVTHFAVTKKEGDSLVAQMHSETTSTIGGLATITSDIFADFHYVALGHIHTHLASPMNHMVYSGSPVVFNTKEARLGQEKGVYIVEVAQSDVHKKFVPLKVNKALIALTGTYERMTDSAFYAPYQEKNGWFSFHITDYDRLALSGVNIRGNLELIYGKDIVEITIEERMKNGDLVAGEKTSAMNQLPPETVVANFYEAVIGDEMTAHQRDITIDIFESIAEE